MRGASTGRGVRPGTRPVGPLVEHLFRRSAGRLTASLTRAFGPHRIDLAEEVVQEALLKALQLWPYQGIPDDPEAWIFRVARNRALDVLRREGRLADPEIRSEVEATLPRSGRDDGAEDAELSMMFLCCHPTLALESRVALALRTVGGLSSDEIARAFLASRASIEQRMVRAKRTLRTMDLALDVPEGGERARRTESVLAVLYLMFSEGYAASEGDALIRFELCGEAIRIVRMLARHESTRGPDVEAVLALFLLQSSRLPARTGDQGELILLEDQDRRLWDRDRIIEGLARITRGMEAHRLTRYHVEAGIAATHATSASWEETPWDRIVDQYDLLMDIAPSPVVAVNRAVAVALAGRPEEALRVLDGLESPRLRRYYLLPASRGRVLDWLGRSDEAEVAYRKALMLCESEPVRDHILGRLGKRVG